MVSICVARLCDNDAAHRIQILWQRRPHKVDVLDENFTPDFASLHHDVCEQLQA
jgi:hypothetical protein